MTCNCADPLVFGHGCGGKPPTFRTGETFTIKATVTVKASGSYVIINGRSYAFDEGQEMNRGPAWNPPHGGTP